MARLSKRDEFQERIGIQADHAKARGARLEARKDNDRVIGTIGKKQAELAARLGEWRKAEESAGRDLKKKIETTARDLKKAVSSSIEKMK